MNVMKRFVLIEYFKSFFKFYFNAFFIEIKSAWIRTKNIDANRTSCPIGQFAGHRDR